LEQWIVQWKFGWEADGKWWRCWARREGAAPLHMFIEVSRLAATNP